MSNQDKIKEIQDRISEKLNQRREITKDLDESIRLDEEEVERLEREWLLIVDGWEIFNDYDNSILHKVKCPYCGEKIDELDSYGKWCDTNDNDYNMRWWDNEIVKCVECEKKFVVNEWKETESDPF